MSSAAAANRKRAASPLESLTVLRVACALPSAPNKAPADSVAPAIPRPLRNDFLQVSLFQTPPQMENSFLSWFAFHFLCLILFQQYCALDTTTGRRDALRMSFDCQLFDSSLLQPLRGLEQRVSR